MYRMALMGKLARVFGRLESLPYIYRTTAADPHQTPVYINDGMVRSFYKCQQDAFMNVMG